MFTHMHTSVNAHINSSTRAKLRTGGRADPLSNAQPAAAATAIVLQSVETGGSNDSQHTSRSTVQHSNPILNPVCSDNAC